MDILSLVIVREGSKGLKNKCLKKVAGKSVFEYSIEYSKELNRRLKGQVLTIVSSDSAEIERYCSLNKIPFVQRTPELASDTTRVEDVIFDTYLTTGKTFKYISLLYGNIPIRYPEEFIKAYNFLSMYKDYDAVLSMQGVEKYNPAWMFEFNESLLPTKRAEGYRRQDLNQFMIHDGHTVLLRTKYLLDFMESNVKPDIMYQAFGKKIKPMLNDRLIVDIDTERDLELADAVLLKVKHASS